MQMYMNLAIYLVWSMGMADKKAQFIPLMALAAKGGKFSSLLIFEHQF